jgi:hypothetical protein
MPLPRQAIGAAPPCLQLRWNRPCWRRSGPERFGWIRRKGEPRAAVEHCPIACVRTRTLGTALRAGSATGRASPNGNGGDDRQGSLLHSSFSLVNGFTFKIVNGRSEWTKCRSDLRVARCRDGVCRFTQRFRERGYRSISVRRDLITFAMSDGFAKSGSLGKTAGLSLISSSQHRRLQR